MKNKEKYYIGLDVGTNSVGWAVTDEFYNILRAKGKDLWGVRLFEKAKTAADTRTFRSGRRRNDRKGMRLQILREIFEDEIKKVDKDFYDRLDESKFWAEDKKVSGKYSLFNDKNFSDKQYFEKFPTIFHLRKYLMEEHEKVDIRYYFLAINQMMKRRGHFLIDGQISHVTDDKPLKQQLILLINDLLKIELEEEFMDSVFEILADVNEKRTDKKNNLKELIKGQDFNKQEGNILNSIFESIVTGKAKIKNIISDEDILEKIKEDNKEDFVLTGDSYEENLQYFEEVLQENITLFNTLKSAYDFVILQSILKGKSTLSDAQVERYDEHKKDLEILKKVIKKYDEDGKLFKQVFKEDNGKGYVSYIGYYLNKNKKIIAKKKISNSDFAKYVKGILEKQCDCEDEDVKYLLGKIEQENFLLKQISSINSVIPHQIHLFELDKILENLAKNYPSFNNKEEEFTKIEKIRKTFRFRIPYYVGPLNDYHKNNGGNAWIFRNKGEKIRPWNFEKIVDLHKSEEEFIKRMLNQCTYLPEETVLPKSSILYSEYMVLNELNNLRIKGNPLDTDVKLKLIEELFKKKTKVTLKSIRDYMIRNNFADKEDFDNSEKNLEIASNMKSYIDFKNILGDKFDVEMVEDLIEKITIHTGNKKLLKKYIEETYPDLSNPQIQKIINLKYKDWGRLSRKLLDGMKGTSIETGEINTVINFMRNSSDNLMQIIEGKNYSFNNDIDKQRKKHIPQEISYEVVENLYVSPSVKKMIWQVIKVTEEITKVMGYEPDKIFIEMAKSEEEKKTTISRKNKLLALYKAIKKDERDSQYNELFDGLNKLDDSDLRSRKLYLYYTQMGRDMYTGEKIDLDKLFDSTHYDKDHIIPQSMKKDDSIINNLVLVNKKANQTTKGNIYPVPSSIRNNPKIYNYWKYLMEKEFISKEKYNRLIRNTPLTNEELGGFINRQLVETRQSTKAIKELFEKFYQKSKIIPVKASLASDLRKDMNTLKSREVNDLQHAHDAFLNIVAGDVWNREFTSNPINYVKENREGDKVKYSLSKYFTRPRKSKGQVIWTPDKGRKLITDTLNKPSVLISNETFVKKGELFNATISGKRDYKKDTMYLPLKKDDRLQDVSKYGGYLKIRGTFFFLVEHTKSRKRIRTIEMFPLHLLSKFYEDKNTILDYAINVLQLKDPKIIIDKINYRTEIEIDGFNYIIAGKTGKQIMIEPNIQMYWTTEEVNKFKYIENKALKAKQIGESIYDNEDKVLLKECLEKIIKKLNTKPYSNRINLPKLKDINFNEFNTSQLYDLMTNLLILTKKTEDCSNLLVINLAKSSGKTLMAKNLDKYSKVYLVYKSITGIYEKRIRIK
ncbi:type II CRISPR RNA-guided endonuclease Cas9 [Finegoldia magna]|uniref:type II CRISPR RNA-guided endonuclease Cas9 n=1 Tax=Finegoldia magna TaxID=1260 RepID=UPI001CE138E2|nr:type II CRISPR RNA-guided endonuclease Cas9 [Finegoldia magna]MCA5587142.1 type II CRISPR RNA-guided endonuclease Cas9 [Finegoldia magna]